MFWAHYKYTRRSRVEGVLLGIQRFRWPFYRRKLVVWLGYPRGQSQSTQLWMELFQWNRDMRSRDSRVHGSRHAIGQDSLTQSILSMADVGRMNFGNILVLLWEATERKSEIQNTFPKMQRIRQKRTWIKRDLGIKVSLRWPLCETSAKSRMSLWQVWRASYGE